MSPIEGAFKECESEFLHDEPEGDPKDYDVRPCPGCGKLVVWRLKEDRRTGLKKGNPRWDKWSRKPRTPKAP